MKKESKERISDVPQEVVETSKLNKKWGKDAIKAGWTAIPSVILERQKSLGLDAMDLAIILHLVKHWWESDRYPYPSKRRICESIGINESTMRKHVAKLEKAGLIKRLPRHITGTKGIKNNEYDLSGLVKRSAKLAQEALGNRQTKEHQASRMRRTKIVKTA